MERRTPQVPILLLPLFLGLGVLSFALVLPAFFVADDFWILGTIASKGPLECWCHGPGGFFRPLTSFSHALDLALWGTNPLGYHLVNNLLHGATAFLVVLLAGSLQKSGGGGASRGDSAWTLLLPGLLFLVLPNHAEPVNWISGRGDLLATFFSLAALLLFLESLDRGRPFLLLSLLSFAAALLSKENGLVVPAFLLLFPGAVPPRRRWKKILPFLLVLVLFLLWRRYALGEWVGGYGNGRHLSPARMVKHLPLQFLRTFLPAFPTKFLFFLFAGIGLAWGAFQVRAAGKEGRGRTLLLLTACLLAALLPTLALKLHTTDTWGERYTYTASAFACLLLGVLPWTGKARSSPLFTGVLLLAPLLYLQFHNRTWRLAGEISRTTNARVLALPPGKRAFLLNLPEKLQGAPIAPLATYSLALDWLYPQEPKPRLFLGVHQVLSSPDQEVRAERKGKVVTLRFPGGAPRKLSRELRALDSKAPGVHAPAPGWAKSLARRLTDRPRFLEVLDQSARGFTARIPSLEPGDQVFFFSKGAFHSLKE